MLCLISLSKQPNHCLYSDFCGEMHSEFQKLTLQWAYIPFVSSVLCMYVCVYIDQDAFNAVFFCNVLNFNIQLSILQDAQGVEERETLARMAANVENTASADSEAYIEKYLRSVLDVENLLTLDRLRQVSPRCWVQWG